tara:strand:- start:2092 stop:3090 length:999 start_codon:yes stop_codon:yes gene_type:complete
MASSATVTKTLALDVEPRNLGLFIGKKGSNFKKIILEFKKAALKKTTEISPEEWSSVELILKFEKTADTTSAVFTCLKKHVPLVVKTLKNFVELHKQEIGDYQKKSHTKKLIFRVGASHRFIPRMIGIGGSRVNQLKHILRELPQMESLKSVVIEEQSGYITGHFTNMGERGSIENILITLIFTGRPDFGAINKIMEEFVEDTTKESEQSEWKGFFGNDEDEYNDPHDGPDGDTDDEFWKFDEQEPEYGPQPKRAWENVEPEPEPEPEPARPKTPHEVLGIDKSASKSEIKKAYMKLAKENHPDKGGDEETFKVIQEAYDKLSGKPVANQED